MQYGQLSLAEFCRICNARSVPVIVDAASEYDLRGFLAKGAALAIYSAHKFLGGPTAGIVAGRKDLVRATYLQNGGIGRGMKVGKESIAGTLAALQAWATRDHAAVRARERGFLELWHERLNGLTGVSATIIPDPTDNPLDRLEVRIDPARAGATAWALSSALAAGDPPVIVRDHEVEHGLFYLDPCNLHDGEAEIVADRIERTLAAIRGKPGPALEEMRERGYRRMLAWPD